MSTINETLASKLIYYRKQSQLTQEELAEQLGVTFQAVSKWETAKSAPDIALLPLLAEIFDCRIDELFGRPLPSAIIDNTLPWENDDTYHAALFKGCHLLESGEAVRQFTFAIKAETVEHLVVHGNAELYGNVHANCTVNGNLELYGNILGDCAAKGNITCDGNINGDTTTGGNLTAVDITGDCTAGNNFTAADITGDCHAGNNLIAADIKGDCIANNNLTAADIKGNCTAAATVSAETITVETVNAGTIQVRGGATLKGEVYCGILECDSVRGGTIIIKEEQ